MGKLIDGAPWATFLMNKGDVTGKCAKCGGVVAEWLVVLDDCYGVYRGQCPACGAINLLGGEGRGYHSGGMTLVLPCKHEIEMNKWPDSPVRECQCAQAEGETP